MKHLLLSIIFAFATTLTCHGQMITLQHNGKIVGTFSNDEQTCFSEAFEHAVEGDTLFLCKGSYYIPVIDKSITIIGAGASECWLYAATDKNNYNSYLRIEAKANSTISQINIEGVNLEQSLTISSNPEDNSKIENISIKKSILHGIDIIYSCKLENMTFESCKISGSTCFQDAAKYLTFRNCEIAYCQSTYSTTTLPKFINCDIINLEGKEVLCINCIIGQVGKGITTYLEDGNILINTLYHRLADYDPAKNCLVQDCYSTEKELAKDVDEWGSKNKLIITEEELLQNNYLGTDGTVVGKSGGARPYSLDMHLPTITKNKLVMDNNNKKVSINVSVTAN